LSATGCKESGNERQAYKNSESGPVSLDIKKTIHDLSLQKVTLCKKTQTPRAIQDARPLGSHLSRKANAN
jgi:hypothetical protein